MYHLLVLSVVTVLLKFLGALVPGPVSRPFLQSCRLPVCGLADGKAALGGHCEASAS